ncbi:MAG: serine/threonine protein kinase, partial [Erysipelotrichaceae bacterium]|nr:serine/threonine protein kinase [Erysipelotrichaceae bacterium]
MGRILNEDILKDYIILDEIGTGGMSKVYRARHKRLGNIWAIKVVDKNQNTKFDFLAEANILKNLDYPMLPKIVNLYQDKRYLYVVEELIEGENLKEILKKNGKFSEKEVVEFFEEIAKCLRYLHTQNPKIIYRDMKPSNLMMNNKGKLKLIDFGIAKEYREDQLTDTTLAGTPTYMAPEQFSGSKSDERTDIYSLGVVLYLMA